MLRSECRDWCTGGGHGLALTVRRCTIAGIANFPPQPSPLPPQRLVLPPRALRLSRCPSYGVSTCSSIDCTSYRSADALATRPSHGSQPAPRWLGLAPSPHKVETAVSATLSLPQLSNAPPACLTSHRHCPWTSHTFVSRTFGSIRLPCLTRPSRRALPAPTCHYQGHTPLRMSFEPNNAFSRATPFGCDR